MSGALQVMNMDQTATEWATRITECRSSGLSVRPWCSEHKISPQTYYRWQRRIFDMVKAQQEVQFADVTPERPSSVGGVAVTVRIAGTEADIHNGADAATVETVLRMLTDFTGADRVIIACGRTDLRLGIDGLAALVKQQFRLDPFTNTLFLFCGRWKDRIKALYWEGNGFVLLYKRLESGSFQWPRNKSEARSLTPQQYRWLMEGLSIDQPRAHKPIFGLEMV